MATVKLKYVNSFYDRHGRLRHQFRRTGHPKKLLPGSPGSAEFMEAYQALIESTGGSPTVEIGARRSKAGTLDAAVAAYIANEAFTKGLAPASQKMRRPILDRLRNMQGSSGQRYGEKQFASLQRGHIQKILEGMTPDAQKNWLKTIRGLMAFAITKETRADDPTKDVKLLKKPKSMGHMTWLEPQVEQYRQRHALGSVARLALELLLNIAARRHDAHEIGPQHVIISNRDGVKKLCWRPHKTLRTTGKLLKITMLPSLQAALDAMPKPERGTELALAFLTNDYGKPFASAAAFGNKFADWCKAAALKPVMCDDGRVRNYRAHGLRKAALRALAHAGCTGVELMHVSGHSSLKQLQEYLEEVEQELMADSAMSKLAAYEAKAATSSD
jgi:integrase/recombinase XerD